MRCAVYIRVSTDKEEQKRHYRIKEACSTSTLKNKGGMCLISILTLRVEQLVKEKICNV